MNLERPIGPSDPLSWVSFSTQNRKRKGNQKRNQCKIGKIYRSQKGVDFRYCGQVGIINDFLRGNRCRGPGAERRGGRGKGHPSLTTSRCSHYDVCAKEGGYDDGLVVKVRIQLNTADCDVPLIPTSDVDYRGRHGVVFSVYKL